MGSQIVIAVIIIIVVLATFKSRSSNSSSHDVVRQMTVVSPKPQPSIKNEPISVLRPKTPDSSNNVVNKPSMFTQLVKGMFYHQSSLKQITKGQRSGEHILRATLRHDALNKFDSNAIEVLIDGCLIGFIPKENTSRYVIAFKSYSSKGEPLSCDARVTWKTTADGIDADVRLDIGEINFN